MRKRFVFLFVLFLVFSSRSVFASGFQIKTIGALDMDGVTASHIWYSNTNPVITGTTIASSDVEINADGKVEKISASSDGTWIYHSTVSEGDHTLTFTSNGSTITKTITIGSIPANVGALTKAETPTVGNTFPTIILFSIGALFLIYPLVKIRHLKN